MTYGGEFSKLSFGASKRQVAVCGIILIMAYLLPHLRDIVVMYLRINYAGACCHVVVTAKSMELEISGVADNWSECVRWR